MKSQAFVLGILVLYILLALTSPRKPIAPIAPNASITKTIERFSPIVDVLEVGTIHVGPGGPNKSLSFDFKKNFSKAPFVFFSPLYGANVSWPDMFQTTIQYITPSTCKFNLQRVDMLHYWGQNLKIMYVAISIQEGSPYEVVNAKAKIRRF